MGQVAELYPNDLGAEAAVISAILLEPECLEKVRIDLEPRHFYADANRTIFQAILDTADAGDPLDIVTVAGQLRARGVLERIGGAPYLAQFADATPSTANVETHARYVKEAALKREAAAIGARIVAESRNGVGDPSLWVEGAAAELTRLAGGSKATIERWPALTVSDIFRPLEAVPYLVEPLDLCPGAPALVAGYGYSGKTLALQSLLLSVAAGLPVWGVYQAKRGRVLHIDYEQGSRLTRERYQRLAAAMMIDPDELHGQLELVSMPALYLDHASAERILTEKCAGVKLCCIDSLRACAPSLDENDSKFRGVLDMLTRISERTGCCFVMVHHARKPTENAPGGSKMSIRGSGAIFDACSSVLVFEGEKGKPVKVNHEKARTRGKPCDPFELHIEDTDANGIPNGGVLVRAEGLSDAPRRDRAKELEEISTAILEAAKAHPGSSKRGLYEHVGGTRSRVYDRIDGLVEERRLVAQPNGQKGELYRAV